MHDDARLPLIRELNPAPTPEAVFERFARRPYCLWLDSAMPDARLGRYSYLAADPVELLRCFDSNADPLSDVQQRLDAFRCGTVPELPPFQGGAAGLLSYELGRTLERVPRARWDEFGAPLLAIGLFDFVVAWDHATGRCWIVSQGYPATNEGERQRRAAARLDEVARWIDAPRPTDDWQRESLRRATTTPVTTIGLPPHADLATEIVAADLAPQFAMTGADLPANLTSNFSADAYRQTVARGVEYIRAGDIFQVNLSQRFLAPATDDAIHLYRRLRRRNPATFAAYFDLGDFQIASASPERFMKVQDRHVETRPIKGTRRRVGSAEANLFMGDELLQSEKDRAENVMIVDLLRNDLSRVCRPDSVRVTQLCGLEAYEYVLHLVSAVEGQLDDNRHPLELVRAAFPGGSITGAPKIRAMEIIAELEPTARGPYCGSVGYFGFNGSMDLNILIRTITAGRGWWQFPAGGGVVVQSRPQSEYEETWHKAAGLLRALR